MPVLLTEDEATRTSTNRKASVDHLAVLFRDHLTIAGVKRAELHASTRTHVQANFRTWRDSGPTWLAMSGLGVDKIMRRAGHDTEQTTMGYVKMVEDLTGDLGSRSRRCRRRSSEKRGRRQQARPEVRQTTTRSTGTRFKRPDLGV